MYLSTLSHGDPNTKKLGSPAMRFICCGRTRTLASSTAPARSKRYGVIWTHVECGLDPPKGGVEKPKASARSWLRALAVQCRVGSYPGYTGRGVDVVMMAAHDPEPTCGKALSCRDQSHNSLAVGGAVR